MYDIDALNTEYAKLHTETGKVISAAGKEARPLTGEEKQENDRRYARMDEIQSIRTEAKRFAAYQYDGGNVELPKTPAGRDEYEANVGRQEFAVKADAFNLDAYKDALNKYAKTGKMGRLLYGTDSTTGSGAWLPKQVGLPTAVRRLQNSFRAALDAAGIAPLSLPAPAAFSLPVGDDTANVGQAQTESATSSTVLDDTDASLSISPTLYSSKQRWFSNTILNAQGFDILSYVVPMLQKRIEKVQESAWTTTLKTLTTGAVTAAGTTAVTYSEVLKWEHALPAAYRTDGVFLVSDALYQAVRGLLDSNNRPIFDLDPTNVFAGRLHGKPVIVNDYLGAMTTGQVVGAFLSADAIKIVDMGDQRIVRYSNVPQYPDQQGFEVFQNGDAKFVSAGVKLLKLA